MAKPKVFVTRRIPEKALEIAHAAAELDIWEDRLPPPYEVLLDKVRGLDGLLCMLTDRIDGPLMDAAGDSLKVISQMAVGFDNIAAGAATQRRIPIGNTPGVLTDTTADLTWALLMAAARRVVEGTQFIRDGKWQTWEPMALLGADVSGATLGIVGFGRIGQAVARRAQGFGMRILYHNSRSRHEDLEQSIGVAYVSLETLLRESDFVSLHTPLNDSTYHLISVAELKQMKSSAILINTARGGVVDPEALYQALKSGDIAYAALDVTEPEPICRTAPY